MASDLATDLAEVLGAGAPQRAPEAPEADAASPADGRSWDGRHALDLRLSVPLVASRYYLAVLGGRERRNAKRRGDERRRNPLATKWNFAFLAVLGLITGLALFAVIQFAARFVLETAGVA
ncbi:MAG: hypothetical protein R3322_02900 [Kiloniellales bacterium]|nr:hypothetical protein [Kiloniellales bacterium]